MKNHLVLNIGSSSIKISLFKQNKKKLSLLCEAHFAWSEKTLCLTYKGSNKQKNIKISKKSKKEILSSILKHLKKDPLFQSIDFISHRIVHGGSYFKKSCQITKKVISTLKKLAPLAPLHNPIEIYCIEVCEKLWTKAKQFTHFDTAFFHDLPKISQTLPLPQSLCKTDIKRYGFHGLSHESSLNKVISKDKKSKQSKIIICHLGSGCSLSAISNQKCLDTTMGFTPLDGLIMGTRPGSLDPGVLLYLLEEKKIPLKYLKELLEKKSGLLGISKKTSDLKELVKWAPHDKNAKLAVDMFVLSLVKHISNMMCSLGGCDHLLFTGGVGENSKIIRKKTIKKLSFLGFEIDPKQKTSSGSTLISTKNSSAKVWVFKSDENYFMAQIVSKKNL